MAGGLGGLLITLGLDSADFSRGLTKSEQDFRRMAQDIERQATQIGRAIGLIAVAGAGVGVALVKQSIDSADAMLKMSQSAGVAIGALSELNFAADLSGVSTEALGTSMSKLNRNIAETASGTGEAKKAFDALGISVKNQDGSLKNADQIIEDVAAAFEQFEDGAGKSALAIQIFGKAGAAMIPLLNAGRGGIREMREEARALGLTMDTETGKAAERFNDNLTRLGAVGKGLSNEVMRHLVGDLASVTDKLVEAAKAGGELHGAMKGVAGFLKDTLIVSFQTLAILGANVAFVFKGVGRELAALAAMQKGSLGFSLLDQLQGPGAVAAQIAKRFSGMAPLSEAAQDAVKARAELDAFEKMIMGLGGPTDSDNFDKRYGGGLAIRRRQAPGVANDAALKKAEDLKKLYEEVVALARSVDPRVSETPGAGVQVNVPFIKDMDKLREMKKTLTESRNDWIKLAEAIEAEDFAQLTAAASGESFTQMAEKQKKAFLEAIDPMEAFNEQLKQAKLLFDVGYISAEQYAKVVTSIKDASPDGRAKQAFIDLIDPLERIRKQMDEVRRLEERGVLTGSQATSVLFVLNDQMDAALALKTTMKDTANEITEFWRAAAENMQSSMSDLFFDFMQGKLGDFGKNFKATIDRMVANVLAAQAATALFGPEFGKKGTEGNIGGFVGQGLTWLSGLAKGFAVGTSFVPRDMLAVVHRGEAIIPANQNNGRGSVSPTFIFNISTPDVNSFRATQSQIAAEMRNLAFSR